jgi:hypothetical protein
MRYKIISERLKHKRCHGNPQNSLKQILIFIEIAGEQLEELKLKHNLPGSLREPHGVPEKN